MPRRSGIATLTPRPREIAMQTRTLGNSDLQVSAIGLGLMSMSGTYGKSDDEQSIDVIHRALDLGINFLDSSDMYGWGQNEEMLGRALKGRRQQALVTTKFGQVQDRKSTRLNSSHLGISYAV